MFVLMLSIFCSLLNISVDTIIKKNNKNKILNHIKYHFN
jgi:hypothetical protein